MSLSEDIAKRRYCVEMARTWVAHNWRSMMPVVGESTWTFSTNDGSHAVQASVETGFRIHILITVDGVPAIEFKANNINKVRRDHVFRVGRHACVIKAEPLKSRWSAKTAFELFIAGVVIGPGEHVNLTSSRMESQQPVEAAHLMSPVKPPAAGVPVPMIPVLPPNCGSCGAPVDMRNVEWTGPLTARCRTCQPAVEVEWKRLG